MRVQTNLRPIWPVDMLVGSEGYTTRSNIHPDDNTMSKFAPIYATADEVVDVLVCRLAIDQFTVFAPSWRGFDYPTSTGASVPVTIHELVELPDACEYVTPRWGGAS